MVDGIILTEKSKEELIKIILEKDKQVDDLAQQLQKQNKKIQELEEKIKKDRQKQYKKAHKPKHRWKKLGAPVGHRGATRPKPEIINHVVEQTLAQCPDCGHADLTPAPAKTAEHIQEDIIPARVEATKFVRHAYWCPHCGAIKMASYAGHEVPCGYLGPNILVQAVLMKYHQGLPYDKIKESFSNFCGLNVTASALAQALQRIAHWLNVEERVIIEAIRKSPYVHMDETGWKIAGTNHWLWNFVNERLALYRIRRSRGRDIPKEVMTKDYAGITISDFLSAYDKTGKLRQRCLVHLKREMDRILEIDSGEDSKAVYKKLNRILNDAYRLNDLRKELTPLAFFHRLHLLQARLFRFSTASYSSNHWQRISARLIKYHREVLTFLIVPGLPSHNNHAERMIRPNVIFRKISFENMSDKGARAHEVLMSLLQTLRLRKENAIEFFQKAYLSHRQGHTFVFMPP